MSLPLADFLLQQRDAILEAWEAEARRVPGAPVLERPALREGLSRLLEAVAGVMARRRAPEAAEPADPGALLEPHALEWLGEGADPRQVVTAYRVLRACVLRLWAVSGGVVSRPDEERVFHEALDEAVSAAVRRYAHELNAREREARAAAEASLRRLRDGEARLKRWEDIFTHLGVGVVVVSADDNVLRMVNPAFARMHGYAPEELVGQSLETMLAPEARGALPRHAAAANSKLSHEYEALHVRKDGSRFPAISHVTSIRDEAGRVVQRAGTVLDITQRRVADVERQRLLATIEAERARLAAVLDQLPAGVFIAEAPSGRLVLGNRQVESLWGFPFRASADISAYSADYKGFHPDGRPYADEEWPLARSLLTGEVVQAEEIQIQRGDDTRAIVLMSSGPIRDRDGVIVAGVAAFVDVTERRRAEELAQQAARFGERLIAIVSHDLRNPLNAIHLSATKLLHSDALPEKERRAVARIAKSGERMTRMISELLDFTRGRLGGGIPIHRVTGDMRLVARQCVEELEAAWPERSLSLKVAPGRYDGLWDADRLLQVVSNLGGNALQYSPSDMPVTFSLADAGDTVVLEVHNAGAPIPPAFVPHLFDPFRRVATDGHGGLGLGLYIVEQVVKGHGGRIEVTSTEAAGTTFRVTLPRG